MRKGEQYINLMSALHSIVNRFNDFTKDFCKSIQFTQISNAFVLNFRARMIRYLI